MPRLYVQYEHPERGEEATTFDYNTISPENARQRVLSYLWNVEEVHNIKFLTLSEYLTKQFENYNHIHKNVTLDEFQRESEAGKG